MSPSPHQAMNAIHSTRVKLPGTAGTIFIRTIARLTATPVHAIDVHKLPSQDLRAGVHEAAGSKPIREQFERSLEIVEGVVHDVVDHVAAATDNIVEATGARDQVLGRGVVP